MTYNFKSLREELDSTVQKNILDYWVNNAVDVNNGGFIGHVSHDNIKDINANKGIVLNSRILWTFSIAYRELNNDVFQLLANRAYSYIKEFFLDEKNGGVYWELDSLGNPVQKKKQIYAQAFTIYALTEYYKISKDKEALDWAIELFVLIEKHSYDEENQGYIEAFAEDWSVLEDMRLSDKDANQEKTMNTHLHILEAYTNLYRVWPDKALKQQQESLIILFLDKFISSDNHLNLFFTNAWENRSRVISFGHDIECAWLLTEAAEVIENDELILKTREASIRISKKFISEALDTDGGIINERNSVNGQVDYEKHWWQHAEALVGLMNAYTISNDEKFIAPIFTIWEFIKKNLIDHKNGEWFWKVNKEGVPDKSQEKIGFWKCPYHNSRACFEMINRINTIDVSINKIVNKK